MQRPRRRCRARRRWFPAAFRLPAFASWASCPARGFRPSCDRPTVPPEAARTRTGFPCSARMRCGWIGCLLYPGGSGARTTGACPRPPPAASQRPAPVTLDYDPPQDVYLTRHQQRFTVVHPSQPSPRLWPPAERDPRAFPRAPHPAGHDPAAHARAWTGYGHCPDYVPGISQPPSTYSLTTCDNASQRARYVRQCERGITRPRPGDGVPVVVAGVTSGQSGDR